MDPVNRFSAALLPAGLVFMALTGALVVLATGPLGVAPDALLAALSCGAALAGPGVGFQILFRNPLAAPRWPCGTRPTPGPSRSRSGRLPPRVGW